VSLLSYSSNGSPTPRLSSASSRRCTITSKLPVASDATPTERSTTSESCTWESRMKAAALAG
jgi:hypothetical protein